MHLTLRFLGEHPEETIRAFGEAVAAVMIPVYRGAARKPTIIAASGDPHPVPAAAGSSVRRDGPQLFGHVAREGL